MWDWHLNAASKISAAIPHGWGIALVELADHAEADTLLLRENAEGLLQVVMDIGNPLIWWVRHAGRGRQHLRHNAQGHSQETLGGRPDHTDSPRLCVSPAPWVPGTRIPYIYNYLPIYPFAILALVYWLCKSGTAAGGAPGWSSALPSRAVALSVYFLPLA